MSKRTEIESLIDKASKTASADEALKFSQAACNAANAMCALQTAENASS